MIQESGEKKLYFVLETKGNIDADALRPTESDKIKCGKEHFKALATGVKFEPVKDFDDFVQKI
ncbi:MAG: type III restriction endonuclease subunit R [Selenomonadaceae bacterium]|nr:type III restriction endonuclease subunit R [Selenomonadaceae bacterium]